MSLPWPQLDHHNSPFSTLISNVPRFNLFSTQKHRESGHIFSLGNSSVVSHEFMMVFKALVIQFLPPPSASDSATFPSLNLFYPYWLSFSSSKTLISFPSQHPCPVTHSFWNAFFTGQSSSSLGCNYNVSSSGKLYLTFQTNIGAHSYRLSLISPIFMFLCRFYVQDVSLTRLKTPWRQRHFYLVPQIPNFLHSTWY